MQSWQNHCRFPVVIRYLCIYCKDLPAVLSIKCEFWCMAVFFLMEYFVSLWSVLGNDCCNKYLSRKTVNNKINKNRGWKFLNVTLFKRDTTTWHHESHASFPGSQTENKNGQNNDINRSYKGVNLQVITCHNLWNIFAPSRLV